MREKPLRRRTPWMSRVNKVRRSRPSPRAEMSAESTNNTGSATREQSMIWLTLSWAILLALATWQTIRGLKK
jgi:hypothetical protein